MPETKNQAEKRRMLTFRRGLNEVAQARRYRAMNSFEEPAGDDLAELLQGVPSGQHAAVREALETAGDPNVRPTAREDAVNGVATAVGGFLRDNAGTEPDTYDPAELAARIPRGN